MILRALAVLVLLSIIGGSTWYFLRSTPQKEVLRLREKVKGLVESRDPADWEEALEEEDREDLRARGIDPAKPEARLEVARRAAERILAIVPGSDADIALRARIEELAGDYPAALKVYDRYWSFGTQPTWVSLQTSRIYRRMGRSARAAAELAAALDEHPYLANLELGRLALDAFQPELALHHFRRAAGHARDVKENPRQRIEALELSADALNLLLLLERTSTGAATGAEADAARERSALRRQALTAHRDEALAEAISLVKHLFSGPREEFVHQQLKLAALHEKYDRPAMLADAVRALQESASADEERRYTQIHLRLGGLKLHLAESSEPAAAEKLRQEAERHFLDSLEVEESILLPEEMAAPADPEGALPAGNRMRGQELKDGLILLIAEQVLGSSESWRLVRREEKGRTDRLELSAGLERLARAEGMKAVRPRLLRGIALLKMGKEEESRALLDEAAGLYPAALRGDLLRQVAEMSYRVRPDSLFFLRFLEAAAGGAEARVERVGPAVRLLSRAIARRRERMETPGALAGEAERQALEVEVAELDRRRGEIIDQAVLALERAEEYLAMAAGVSGVRGREKAIGILRQGLSRLERAHLEGARPEGAAGIDLLRDQLGTWLLEKAMRLEVEARRREMAPESRDAAAAEAPAPWEAYRECLAVSLPLLKEHPYRKDLLLRALAIITRFRDRGRPEDLDLTSLMAATFPGSLRGEAALMAEVFELLAAGRHPEISSRAEALRKAEGLRPYSTLILGSALLEESQRLSGNLPGPSAEGKGDPGKDLRSRARLLFQEESARSPGYLPIRVELARIELWELRRGEDVPESLLQELKQMTSRVRESDQAAYQVFTLQALALRRRMEFLLASPDGKDGASSAGAIYRLLLERRTALRRAIRSGPGNPEAYLALAETYLGPRTSTPGTEEAASRVLEPDHQKAVNVLQGAPRTQEVLVTIARVLMQDLRRPQEALPYWQECLRREPGEAALRGLISCYAASADPAFGSDSRRADREGHRKARQFLEEFEKEIPGLTGEAAGRLADFPALKAMFLGMLAQDEARFSTALDQERLQKEALARFQEAVAQFRKSGRAPPPEVSNNLAWLLSEDGKGAEALQVIEEARRVVADSGSPAHRNAIEDTYGWVLHGLKEHEKAEAVYRKLVTVDRNPSYQYHLAHVLFERKDYEGAAAAIEAALSSPEPLEDPAKARALKASIELKIQQKFARDAK